MGSLQKGSSNTDEVSTDSKANGVDTGLGSVLGGSSEGTSSENVAATDSEPSGATDPAKAQTGLDADSGSSPNAGHSAESNALADKFCQQFPNLQISSGMCENAHGISPR